MSNSTYVLDDKFLASNGSRFLNYILDLIFMTIGVFAFILILAILANLFGWDGLRIWMENMSDLEGQLICFGFFIFYYLFFETLFGRSIGKFITGTIVVNENGLKPRLNVVLKRTFCRIIPFEAFSFLGNSGRGWHDSISDTYVVRKKALDKEVKMFKELNLIGTKEVN